jgi:hypothetical protein
VLELLARVRAFASPAGRVSPSPCLASQGKGRSRRALALAPSPSHCFAGTGTYTLCRSRSSLTREAMPGQSPGGCFTRRSPAFAKQGLCSASPGPGLCPGPGEATPSCALHKSEGWTSSIKATPSPQGSKRSPSLLPLAKQWACLGSGPDLSSSTCWC